MPVGREDTARALPAAVGAFLLRHLVWLVLVAIVAVMAVVHDRFWTTSNLVNILSQVSIIGLLAVGVALVLIAGHFDLSVGAILALAAVTVLQLQPVDGPSTLLAVGAALVIGLAVGALNGLMVGPIGANSIIVTIGMAFLLGGATLLLAGGQHVRVDGAAPVFSAIGTGQALGVPVPVYLLLAVVAVAQFAMAHTLYGRHLRAVGTNQVAAALVGIPVGRRVLETFMISGVLAATAGIVLAARVRNLDPTAGAGYEFAALTAAVLGGTRLTGGHGDALQTLAGVLILGVVANAMRLFDLSYNLQLLFQGAVLIAAVTIDARSRGAA